jgi:hypothetical protein
MTHKARWKRPIRNLSALSGNGNSGIGIGKALSALTLEETDAIWNQVKIQMRNSDTNYTTRSI